MQKEVNNIFKKYCNSFQVTTDLLDSPNLKVAFYCVNTSYPMDNLLDRRRPARQTSEKDVLCFHRLAGP